MVHANYLRRSQLGKVLQEQLNEQNRGISLRGKHENTIVITETIKESHDYP
jgi:hypothetical protein